MRRHAVGVGVVAAALVAGCDAGGPGPTGPTSTASSAAPVSSPAPASSVMPTDGRQLVVDARTALYSDVSSFHVAGTIAEYDVVVDLQVGRGRISGGTVSYRVGGTLEVRQVADGTRYGRGDAAFYTHAPATGPDLSGLAGRWVVIGDDAPAPLDVLGDYANEDTLVFAAGFDPLEGDYTIAGPRDVDGTSAYVVTGPDDTWTVAADGPPLPIAATNGRGEGTVRFDRYDEPFTVTAPAAVDIVPVPTA